MKTRKSMPGLALAMLLPAAVLAAPSEGVMTYSGYLRTSSGAPETAPQSLTFTLYDAATGGATVWSQTVNNVQPDAQGWFSVVLGASPSAFPPGEFASQTWLGIKVGSEAEMVPRTKLGAAPAALSVEYAGVSGCTAANQILQWSGTAWQCIATPAGGAGGGVTSVGGATGGFITASPTSGAVSLSLTGCPSGNQILQWTGTAWQCIATPSGGTGGFTPPACGSPNMVMQWSGTVWQCAADATGLTSVAVTTPLTGSGTAGQPLGIGAASGTSSGYLTSADWNTFSNKVSSITAGSRIATTTGTTPTISLASCTGDGQILKYTVAGGWDCAADADSGGTVTSVVTVAPLTSTGGTTPTIALPACAAGQVLRSTGTGWACAASNSSFKLSRLTAFATPAANAVTNMIALTFTAPSAGTALAIGTGYCNLPTTGAVSFEILIGTAATSTCNFLCLVGQPCDRSYCANFNWPTASPQSQTPYAAQRELPVAAGTNTVYLNFNNTSAQTGITCYASLSVTFNADNLP